MELEFSGVCKEFRDENGVSLFSLHLPEMVFTLGEIVFIMGHNGSGKTVLLRLMAGDIGPSRHIVSFRLDTLVWKAHERPCSIVRQRADDSLATELTVRENLLLRIKVRSLLDSLFPKQRLEKQIIALLSDYPNLLEKLDQPCRHLSVGQRQTLAFISVASQGSTILLLDEFLAATDHDISQLLRRMVRKYAQDKPACVFIVSHDTETAAQDADRILFLRNGQLIKDLHKCDPRWSEKTIINVLLGRS